MKTSRPALQNSSQEECGVWLDTVQLKGKAKQKRLARPISKLLNPFAEGGYSLAVALNLTQTKMEMPKTKQSSISSFFTRQRREVLNKMSTSEAQNADPQQACSPSTLTAATPVTSGTKRGRDTDLGTLDLCYSREQRDETGVDYEWRHENVTEPEAVMWWEKDEVNHTSSQNTHIECEEEQCEEMKPPQRKRRFSETASLPVNCNPDEHDCSQDPLITCSLQSEAVFGLWMNVEGRTSTQKSFKHFQPSQIDDEKENSTLSSKSPKTPSTLSPLSPLSNHRQTGPKHASPQKHIPDPLWKRTDKEEESLSSEFKWTKPNSSLLKRQAPQKQHRESEEDSLAMLFTQDSEGFRVIAHRGLQARSPLKDQSNLSTGIVMRPSAFKSLSEEDEEEEVLFTQDSQENMVIKH